MGYRREIFRSRIQSVLNDTIGFLVYAGEPIIEKRKSMGVWVIGFLLIFLILSYALYKDIWREVK